MPFDSVLRDLIGRIYDTVLEPQRWPETLGAIGASMRGASAILAVHQFTGDVDWAVISGLDPASLPKYQDDYASANTNPYLSVCRSLPLEEPISAETLSAPEHFEETEFFRTMLAPQRLRHSVIVTLVRDEQRVAAAAFLRKAEAGPFAAAELGLLRELAPHLGRALKLTMRIEHLEARSSALAAALGSSATGTVLLDANGHVVFLNRAASKLLRKADGIALHDGRLELYDEAARSTLAERLVRPPTSEDALDGCAALAVPRPSREQAFRLVIWPLYVEPTALPTDLPRALLLIDDPAVAPRSPIDALASIYGLTPTESELASLLTRGYTLAHAAAHMDVSINTVKSHLKQVFAKTSTRRQADLLRLVLQFPPLPERRRHERR